MPRINAQMVTMEPVDGAEGRESPKVMTPEDLGAKIHRLSGRATVKDSNKCAQYILAATLSTELNASGMPQQAPANGSVDGYYTGGGTGHTRHGHSVFHISHGRRGGFDGCSAFFTLKLRPNGLFANLVGVGWHHNGKDDEYKLDWCRSGMPGWAAGSVVKLK